MGCLQAYTAFNYCPLAPGHAVPSHLPCSLPTQALLKLLFCLCGSGSSPLITVSSRALYLSSWVCLDSGFQKLGFLKAPPPSTSPKQPQMTIHIQA